MKKITLLISLLILAFACTKESDQTVVSSSEGKTFKANIEQVKTALGAADIVKWSEGDKIRVVGYTSPSEKGEAVFKIKSGAGTTSAVFELDEGQALDDYDEYYAFYPSNIGLNLDLNYLPGGLFTGDYQALSFKGGVALPFAELERVKLVFNLGARDTLLILNQGGVENHLSAIIGFGVENVIR